MKRSYQTLHVLCVVAGLLGVLLATDALAGPHIVFRNLEYDWGEIDQGSVATYTFHFQNDGDKELELYQVESSCECTVPTASAMKVPAGGSAQIDVTFDSERFTGNVTKEITVQSNDPTQPEVYLTLYASVRPGVLVEPATLDLGVVPRGGGVKQTVTLTASDGTPFTISDVAMGLDFLKANAGASASTPSTTASVEVSVAPGATPGPFTDFLQITTTHPTRDSIQVMVRGEVESLFQVEPDRISFGSIKGKEQKLGEITIRFLGSGAVHFLEASSSTPGLRGEIKEQGQGAARLEVYMTDDVKAGRLSGTITVQTDNPEQPALPVRVVGFVRG